MPPCLNAPSRNKVEQASTAMNGEVRRSGTTPPPTAAWPWQTLQKRSNNAFPLATVGASATSGGGGEQRRLGRKRRQRGFAAKLEHEHTADIGGVARLVRSLSLHK